MDMHVMSLHSKHTTPPLLHCVHCDIIYPNQPLRTTEQACACCTEAACAAANARRGEAVMPPSVVCQTTMGSRWVLQLNRERVPVSPESMNNKEFQKLPQLNKCLFNDIDTCATS